MVAQVDDPRWGCSQPLRPSNFGTSCGGRRPFVTRSCLAILGSVLRDSYQTRGLSFAFLIGPPRNLERQIGMAIHAAICEALGLDDIGFKYQPGDTQPGGEKTFETVASAFVQGEELSNLKRDVSVEVLRQDPRSLYLEVMSQWPQVAVSPDGTVHLDPGTIRSFELPPSEYLINTVDYTESVLLPFLDHFRPTQ